MGFRTIEIATSDAVIHPIAAKENPRGVPRGRIAMGPGARID
jgi:hypothetical protein